MSDARTLLFFHDFVDPGSYLMEVRLEALAAVAGGSTVVPVPFELRPPPEPMLDAGEPAWLEYWRAMADRLEHEGHPIARPRMVPWTRKAHELVLFAAERGIGAEARRAIYASFHEGGEDIGRVDVLLRIASALGLDATETKATLDVDRFADDVGAGREKAARLGVRGVPTLVKDGRALEGVQGREALRRFLEGAPDAT